MSKFTLPYSGTIQVIRKALNLVFPLDVEDSGHSQLAEALIKRTGQPLLVYDEENQQLAELEVVLAAGEFTEFETAFNAQLS